MKKWPLIVGIVAIGFFVGLLSFAVWARFSTAEDTWICKNGEWLKHGKPSDPKPTLECRLTGEKKAEPESQTKGVALGNPIQKADDFVNSLPDQNPVGPVEINGALRFLSPVFNLGADIGVKVCQWGKPPEIKDNCNSIKAKIQNYFAR